MKRFVLSISLVLLGSFILLGSATAGGPPTYTTPNGSATSAKSRFQTMFSLGVQWDFGDKKPQVLAGVRRTQTTTQSAVYGGKVDVAFPLTTDSFLNPTLRLLAVGGNRSVQAEAGVGATRNAQGGVNSLLALGAQVPFVNGGVNFGTGKEMAPYLGVNTVKRAVGPAPSSLALTCQNGYTLTSNPSDLSGSSGQTNNGYTCKL